MTERDLAAGAKAQHCRFSRYRPWWDLAFALDAPAAGTVIAMVFAGGGNADSDGRLVSQDFDVMPEVLRRENDVARLDSVRLGSVFVMPGELAFEDNPGFVVLVIMVVVFVTGRLIDNRDIKFVGRDDPLRPRRRPLTFLDFSNLGSEYLVVENERYGHGRPSMRKVATLAAARPIIARRS